MKRFLHLTTVAMLSVFTSWAQVEIYGIYYNLNKTNNTAEVTNRSNSYSSSNLYKYRGSIYIPESISCNYEEYSVTSISKYAFYDCSDLTSVKIPNSVTSISSSTFSSCSGLIELKVSSENSSYSSENGVVFNKDKTELIVYPKGKKGGYEIPNSVTSIGSSAFSGCSGLTSVTIPNSVTSIGDDAFSGCSGLTSVTIPNSVTSIGDDAFNGCSGLTSVTIPNSVTSIGDYAFSYCYDLTSVDIGNSVTSIGNGAFLNCAGLTKVNYLGSVDKWVEIDFEDDASNPTNYEGDLYINGELLTDVKISTADSIKKYAFYCCQSIKSVELGNSVTSIGNGAFRSCRGLTSVEIPNSVTSIGSYAFSGCSGLTSVEIPNSVTSIDDYAFYYCDGLTSVTIPNSVTSIGDYAFSYCYDLTSVTIPNSVTSIGDYAFSYCHDLTSVEIPNSVTSIGDYVFNNCSGLTSVTIGNSVTSIGDYVFNNCSGLTSVVWNAKNYSDFSNYSSSPFYDFRSKITSLTFGSEVEHIPAYLCYEMSNLTKVNYLGSVEKWVGFDFSSSTSNPTYYAKNLYINGELLTDVKISSEDSIKNYVFYNCESIESVKISSNVISIGSDAFYGCSDLKKVVNLSDLDIIKGKTTYGYVAYYADVVGNKIEGDFVYDNNDVITEYIGDVNITSIEIPLKAKGIYKTVFTECTKLTSVVWSAKNCAYFSNNYVSPFYNIRSNITSFTFGNEVEYIPSYLCYRMENLKEITIPSSVTSIGEDAFRDCTSLTKVNYLGSVDKWVEIDFEDDDNNPTYYAKDLYINGELLTDVKITSADSIKKYAFYNCKSIKSVEIGNSVTSIGEDAFRYCTGLTKVNYLGSVDKWVEINFYNSYSNPTYYAKDLYINGELLTDVKITSAESIEDYAFYNCKSIKSVEIGDGVTSIGSSAFSYCYDLTSVTIPNSVTSIGSSAFEYCSDLTSVEIPNSVTSIGDYAFYNCYRLTSVTIPNSVTSIGYYAFNSCRNLTSVVWNVKYYEDFSIESSSPFYNSDITSFTIGNEVEYVPAYLCCDNNNLTSVIIGENVRNLGAQVFKGCDNLKRVTAYPKSVPSVYENTFAHYNAYLYVPCDVYENYDLHNVFGSFKYIKCIAADEVEAPEKVEIEVDENNNATVIWPSINSASSYELVISKDGTTFCTLIFNANGQLTSIDFNTRSAEVGFQFTVTGLDGASKYDYLMTALDKKGNELESYKGTFTTNGYGDTDTAIIENLADANITISEGVIYCPDSDFTIYNTIGQNVTSQNGSLTPGVYVVQVADDVVKVMMK